ncbi:MAG: ATP-binding protein [Dehalococcoidia bacterium]
MAVNATAPAPLAPVPLPRRVLARLLAWPLWQKVLIANSTLVVFGAITGTAITAERARALPDASLLDLIVPFTAVALAVSILVNLIIVRTAFLPLTRVERAIAQVRGGDRSARILPGVLADPEVERVADTFNAMLDEVEARRLQVDQVSQQVITAQEEERRRIARELHDDTAQSLTSLLFYIGALEKGGPSPEVAEILGELRDQIRASVESVRRLARELRPAALDDLGLVAALDWYIAETSSRLGIPITFEHTCPRTRLPEKIELVLYRICQEALTNAGKHAQASRIAVDLACAAPSIRLTIRDDGRGFAPVEHQHGPSDGIGLYGMRERAALVGGTLRIDSRPGAGTRVTVEVPRDG